MKKSQGGKAEEVRTGPEHLRVTVWPLFHRGSGQQLHLCGTANVHTQTAAQLLIMSLAHGGHVQTRRVSALNLSKRKACRDSDGDKRLFCFSLKRLRLDRKLIWL